MRVLSKNDILASFIAALVAGPVFAWLGNIFFPPPKVMADSLLEIVFVLPIYIQIITYPISIIGMLVIGIPYHALIRKIYGEKYLIIGLSGGPLVFLMTTVLSEGLGNSDFSWLYVACGASVSACYAFLSQKFNKHRLLGRAYSAPQL